MAINPNNPQLTMKDYDLKTKQSIQLAGLSNMVGKTADNLADARLATALVDKVEKNVNPKIEEKSMLEVYTNSLQELKGISISSDKLASYYSEGVNKALLEMIKSMPAPPPAEATKHCFLDHIKDTFKHIADHFKSKMDNPNEAVADDVRVAEKAPLPKSDTLPSREELLKLAEKYNLKDTIPYG
jgi:hypothetical protein